MVVDAVGGPEGAPLDVAVVEEGGLEIVRFAAVGEGYANVVEEGGLAAASHLSHSASARAAVRDRRPDRIRTRLLFASRCCLPYWTRTPSRSTDPALRT